MFGNNQTVMELRLTGDPERSDRADVVKCSACMFQGKKDDDIKPIWITLQAWKYQAKVLEGLQKGKNLVVGGNIKQDHWNDREGNEKSRLVLTAEWMAEKLWAQNNQQNQQGYQQNQQPAGGRQGYNQGPQQPPQYQQNQGGFYPPPGADEPPF